MRQMREAFSVRLAELESLHISPQEKEEADLLSALWGRLSKASADQEQSYRSLSPDDAENALSGQLALFSRLRIETQSMIGATRRTIESRVAAQDEATLLVEEDSFFTARVEAMTSAQAGAALELAVDPYKFHFFDPQTGESLLPNGR